MERNILLAIIASALVTALMRVVPVLLLSRFRMPPALQQWLSFIPAAIMSAIIAAELVGALSRSLFATVIAGMAAFMGLSYLLA